MPHSSQLRLRDAQLFGRRLRAAILEQRHARSRIGGERLFQQLFRVVSGARALAVVPFLARHGGVVERGVVDRRRHTADQRKPQKKNATHYFFTAEGFKRSRAKSASLASAATVRGGCAAQPGSACGSATFSRTLSSVNMPPMPMLPNGPGPP